MKQLALLGLIVLAFSACTKKSTKIDTNQIYQHYRFEYHEHSNETHIKCRLRKKKDLGANIKFIEGDYVAIMGTQEEYEGAGAYTYTHSYYSFLDSAYVTVYHQGTTINNYGLFDNVFTCSIPSNQDIVYSGYTWYFNWIGPPLQSSNDEIKIEIITSDDDVVMEKTSDDDDYNDITIYSSDFANLSGYYKIRVTRVRELPLVMLTGSGGKIEMVYVDEDYVNII